MNYEKIADYVSRAINNDQDAYTQLYNCTYHIVYNIACASIKDPEEAKDVVSEVYLRAFSHLDSLKNELTFVSWLITITNNICRDHLSEHGHAPMVVSPSEPNMAQADPIEEWLEHDNLKTALNDLMSKLPEAQQRAIYCVYYKQMTVAQTAAVENCPIGTIKTRLYYARETLRRAIIAEEKKRGDKLHLPVATVAIAALMALPQVGFTLPAHEAASILTSVLAILGAQSAGAEGVKVYSVVREDDCESNKKIGIFKKSLLIKLKPVYLIASVFIILAAVISAVILLRAHDHKIAPVTALNDHTHSVTHETTAEPVTVAPDPILPTPEETEPETIALVFETESDFTNNGVSYGYTITDKSVTVTSADISNTAHLVIPDTIDGYPVKHIGNRAFENCNDIESLSLPNGLETIGAFAFWGCTNLKTVEFPDTLTYIGENAFSFCTDICELNLPASLDANLIFTAEVSPFVCLTALEKITVHEDNMTMRVIDGVLYKYDMSVLYLYPGGLRSLEFSCPQSVRMLGAYSVCSDHLLTLRLNESLEGIGNGALMYCTRITSLRMPAACTSYGLDAFASPDAREIKVTAGTKSFYSINNCLYSYDNTHLYRYPAGYTASSYNIYSKTTSVGQRAFFGSNNLVVLTMNNNITEIAEEAFAGMSNIEYITLSSGITEIPARALADNPKIRLYKLPENITSIDPTAFEGCPKLTKIEFTGDVIPCPEEDIVLDNPDCIFVYPANKPEWVQSEWAERYKLTASEK